MVCELEIIYWLLDLQKMYKNYLFFKNKIHKQANILGSEGQVKLTAI